MNPHDSEYLNTCKAILEYGRMEKEVRTDVGRIRLPGQQMNFEMADGFPLLTSAQKSFKMIQAELEMFLIGETNNKFLLDKGIRIWEKNEGSGHSLGPMYGAMWRGLHPKQPIDQLKKLMHDLANDPYSSRHVVTAWVPELLPTFGSDYVANVAAGKQCLPPCHALWQVHCFRLTLEERLEIRVKRGFAGFDTAGESEEELTKMLDALKIPRVGATLQMYQRSADMFLGVPFNIASYALLLEIICHSLNMHPLELIWQGGDCHIYENHVDQMKEQIARKSKAPESPTLHIHSFEKHPWLYEASDFEVRNYNPLPAIKGDMAA